MHFDEMNLKGTNLVSMEIELVTGFSSLSGPQQGFQCAKVHFFLVSFFFVWQLCVQLRTQYFLFAIFDILQHSRVVHDFPIVITGESSMTT